MLYAGACFESFPPGDLDREGEIEALVGDWVFLSSEGKPDVNMADNLRAMVVAVDSRSRGDVSGSHAA